MPYRSSLLLLYKFRIPLAGQVEIALRRPLRLFLKTVQYIDRIFKPRHIQYAEDTRFIFDPNLLHSGSNIRHRLEIFRFQPVLHAVKLVSCLSPRVLGKFAEILQGTSPELEVFHRGFLRRVRHD
jgi:hypothetical protein